MPQRTRALVTRRQRHPFGRHTCRRSSLRLLRCKPPLLPPRRAVRDSTICGFDIKAGTLVLANNHALTQSARWWRDPALFRPSRFLEEEAGLRLRPPGTTARAGAGDVDACKFIPFSIGARVCPGARLAEAQLYAAATRVLLSSVRWAS